MKKLFIFLSFAFISMNASAANYKCFASQFPTDKVHYFSDGYVLLSVNKRAVNLKYYYQNEVAHETTLESDVTYAIKGIQGGTGKLSKLSIATFQSAKVGSDRIGPIYLEQSLIKNTKPDQKGIVGKFAFSGHGYGYDWNVCYNQK